MFSITSFCICSVPVYVFLYLKHVFLPLIFVFLSFWIVYVQCTFYDSVSLFSTHLPLFLSITLSTCLSLSQSKADGDVLDYKQFAALPRVKAIYERPDIIPYQADHSHTRLSDDTLERYSCGQVCTHTHTHTHTINYESNSTELHFFNKKSDEKKLTYFYFYPSHSVIRIFIALRSCKLSTALVLSCVTSCSEVVAGFYVWPAAVCKKQRLTVTVWKTLCRLQI